jgi:hypothetical protein
LGEDSRDAIHGHRLDSADILEERGFEVYLVNARHTKNLQDATAMLHESQWLLKLHTYGSPNNSFQPPSEIRTLRTHWRQPGRGGYLHSADAESANAGEPPVGQRNQ